MDEVEAERQRHEVRTLILSVATLGFLGFATVLVGAAVINIRDNNPQTHATLAPSQPTVTTGRSQEAVPAPAERAPAPEVK